MSKRALIIGVNYRGTQHALNGCINDAHHIRDYLMSNGFAPENISLITDDTHIKPTRNNILLAISNLVLSGDKDLFFHYSGHGSYIYDKDGDEADSFDECLVPVDYDTQGMIKDDNIRSVLSLMKSNQHMVCILDCCHSGTGVDMGYNAYLNLNKQLVMKSDSNYIKLDGSIVMFSGCQDYQYSADAMVNGKYQGAMSWAFLDAVKTLDPSLHTYRNILTYIRKLLKESEFDQYPNLSSNYPIDLDWGIHKNTRS